MNHLKPNTAFIALALALVLAACSGSGGDGGNTTDSDAGGDPGDTEVVVQNIAFQPAEMTVETGTEVTWTNEDGVTHTTTSDDAVWDSGNLSSGDSFSHTFEEAGTYTYTCQIHPTMRATITVVG